MISSFTKTFIDISIPILVFFTMIVVGLDLTIEDFRQVMRKPRAVVFGTLGQLIFLPIVAIMLVHTLKLTPYILSGILLIAACPGGGISNYYVYLARSNTALSVTLTAISCLLAAITLPVLMNVYELYLNIPLNFSVPFPIIFGQLIIMLVIPTILGMCLRHFKPVFTKRYEALFRGVSIAALAGIVGFVVYQEAGNILLGIEDTVLASVVFIVISMIFGLGMGSLLGLNANDRFTLLVEFAVRNIAIATAIAVTVLNRIEFAVFATVYFLTQVPLVVLATIFFKRFQPNRYGLP
jgi:BASS family bile acid:Na+ symporter